MATSAATTTGANFPLSISVAPTEPELNSSLDSKQSSISSSESPFLTYNKEEVYSKSTGDDECSSLSSSDAEGDANELDEAVLDKVSDDPANEDSSNDMPHDVVTHRTLDVNNTSTGTTNNDQAAIKELQHQLTEAILNADKYKKQVEQSREQSLQLVKKCSLLEAKIASSSHMPSLSSSASRRSPSPTGSASMNSRNSSSSSSHNNNSHLETHSSSAPLPDEQIHHCSHDVSSYDVKELVKLVARYQAQHKTATDTCVMLQSKVDHDAKTIAKLKSAHTILEEEKSQVEMELLNQLSSLAQSSQRTEEEYKKELHEKCCLIEQLRVTIKKQGKKSNESSVAGVVNVAVSNGSSSTSADKDTLSFLQAKISRLQRENEELQCDVHTLSARNAVLNQELLHVNSQMEHYQQLETQVVPELKAQLESARSSLSVVERDMALINQEKQWMRQRLRKSSVVAKSTKCELETLFLGQLQDMEEAHRVVVLGLETQLRERGDVIISLERTVKGLNEKLLRFEAMSELDSISASGEVEYVRQQYLDSQEQLKQLQQVIMKVRQAHKECKDSNVKLAKDVGELQQQLSQANRTKQIVRDIMPVAQTSDEVIHVEFVAGESIHVISEGEEEGETGIVDETWC